MAKYSSIAIEEYISGLRFNTRLYTIGEECPDYIITHFDTLSGEPTQIEVIRAEYCGLEIAYTHRRYTKRVPNTVKEYIITIGRKAWLPKEEWLSVVEDVNRTEKYWS